MINITLKGGTVKEYPNGISPASVAADLGAGLYKAACAAKINGKTVDLRTLIINDCELEILTFNDKEGQSAFRHTASHILAQAVKRLYPKAKLTIGPSIDNGFYYDIDSDVTFDNEALGKIEAEMKKIVKENIKIERTVMTRSDAIAFFNKLDEPYKVELIKALPENEEISCYTQGDFCDLCAGPHLMSTAAVKALKLTSCTGAYWHGDSNNKVLQRIYGTAFPKASELEKYLIRLEDAKKRDHNKLGRELEIFTTSDLIGQGLPILLPNGAKIVQILERFVEDEDLKRLL